MNGIFKILIVCGAIAVVALVVQNSLTEAELDNWRARATARAAGGSTEAYEDALAQASGSTAGLYISYDLAQAYLDAGEPADLDRAIQVAEAALAADPDPSLRGWLERVVAAARSFKS